MEKKIIEQVQGRKFMKIISLEIVTFCSLKTCLNFLTQVSVFCCKKLFIFIYYNIKIHPLPFKSPIFFEKLASKKNADTSLWR